MANDNLTTCRFDPQKGKPDRKVYSITNLDRKSLLEWFQYPAHNPTNRDEISAKLLVCGIHNSESMQKHIEAKIKEHKTQLIHLCELEYTQYSNYKELGHQARIERLALRRNNSQLSDEGQLGRRSTIGT